MRNNIKRISALALSVLFIVISVAGCASSSGNVTTTAAATTAAATTTDAATTAAANLVTLQVYGLAINPSNTCYQWQEDYFADKIGIQIEVIPYDKEKIQPMLAAGNLPDIGKYAVDNDPTAIIEGNLVQPLDDYTDKLPNYMKYDKAVAYAKAIKSDNTGKLYAFMTQIGVYDAFPFNLGTYECNVRWDIYDKAGKPEVTDFYTLLDAFAAMKKVYPKTAEGLETYALGLHPEWDGTLMSAVGKYTGLSGYWGEIGYNYYDCVNEQIVPVIAEGSPYYEGLKWLNTANRMGLIDPDSMTQTYAITQSKLKESQQYYASMPGNYVDGFNTSDHNNADDPIGFLPLIWDTEYAVVNNNNWFGSEMFFVSSTTKNLEACLKFMNFMYSDECLMTLYGGPQGELWDIKDGKWVLTDAVKAYLSTGSHTFYTGESSSDFWGGYTLCAANSTPYGGTYRITDSNEYNDLKYTNNKLLDMYEAFYGVRKPADLFKSKNLLSRTPDWKVFISAKPQEITDLVTNIKSIIVQASWKIVMNATSDDEVDAMYKQMMDDANAMGLQTVVDWGKSEMENAQKIYSQFQ